MCEYVAPCLGCRRPVRSQRLALDGIPQSAFSPLVPHAALVFGRASLDGRPGQPQRPNRGHWRHLWHPRRQDWTLIDLIDLADQADSWPARAFPCFAWRRRRRRWPSPRTVLGDRSPLSPSGGDQQLEDLKRRGHTLSRLHRDTSFDLSASPSRSDTFPNVQAEKSLPRVPSFPSLLWDWSTACLCLCL